MAQNSQSRTARRKQLKQKKRPLWKKIALIFGIIALATGLGVGALFTYYIAAAPDIDDALLQESSSTKVYDMNKEIFADLGAKKRTKITYDDLPDVLVNAVIATEDARFFDHIGIDFRRIGAAVIANVTDGFGSQGASTITQQVVKRSFLSPEKTIERKVQEQWLAIKLDSKYSKEDILEMYLNKIFYGNNAYGVAKAAEIYFGKTDLKELTLPEAALLAGLPQRPSAYDPYNYPERAQERKNIVLDLMVQHNKISEKEANEAKKVTVESMLIDDQPNPSPYEAFLKQVREEVMEKADGADIYKDSLKVYTTLDQSAQQQVEYLLSEESPITYPDNKFQAGLTVLDTKTGAIRAIGGGRKLDDTQRGWNYAIDGDGRQAGSTFKPITAYGPAIETKKWSTYHQLNDDKPFPIAGTDKVIQNYNNRNQGWMTMRYALKESLNVPAVKTLDEVGYSNAQKFAEGLGIEFSNDQMQIGDAIGGTATGVTPLELAGAYRAFGNEGIYSKPFSVTKIEFSDGKTIDFKPESKAAMSEYTAYMITDMLKSVVNSGTGTAANISGLPVAGKTGTTNIEGKDGSNNSWFSGYTTNYTISVWTGYDENNKIIPSSGLGAAKELFRQTMLEISKGKDTPDFVMPDSVVEVAVEKGSNPAKLPSDFTPKSEIVTELFVKGNTPTETSDKYNKLKPVEGLKAKYNKDKQSIEVSWKYKDMNDANPVSFEVNAGTGDSLKNLATTKEKSVEISNVEQDTTYTIEVIVASDENENNVSDPVTVEVKVPKEKEEKKDEDEDENEDEGDNSVKPVEDLSASYDPTGKTITAQWKYPNGKPVNFEVRLGTSSNDMKIVTTTAEQKAVISIENDQVVETYYVEVTAIDNKKRKSSPSTVKVTTIQPPPEQDGND
ncbi:PBP1A family penicillin-binding protein [Aquibacillus sp. 3ASR75-11]|uniref:PBP1A family penicillin-binding protein n=1 Tax=Terrihalobacillus insolitus TaxID=2950438 RepID=A0A9X3WWT3_9BACI|nr:PBP1A family penicillin-binding protein [Terrihalobacillus insolitus]MDC3413017.1 PBP1A family penicillin-binding protein [Terrihalobacillus insolitus]MDC3424759.1 PBP1A family penicillin-binding protein [Terrihalobacillus insolitus]